VHALNYSYKFYVTLSIHIASECICYSRIIKLHVATWLFLCLNTQIVWLNMPLLLYELMPLEWYFLLQLFINFCVSFSFLMRLAFTTTFRFIRIMKCQWSLSPSLSLCAAFPLKYITKVSYKKWNCNKSECWEKQQKMK
jgi:hypothetical protein